MTTTFPFLTAVPRTEPRADCLSVAPTLIQSFAYVRKGCIEVRWKRDCWFFFHPRLKKFEGQIIFFKVFAARPGLGCEVRYRDTSETVCLADLIEARQEFSSSWVQK